MVKRIRGIVLLACVLWLVGCSQPSALSAPMTWNGLTPSKSTLADVANQWPEYESRKDMNNGEKLQITVKIEFGTDGIARPYKEYNVWLEQDKVQVIDIQWSRPELAEPEYQALAEIIGRWGRPAIVTWSNKRYARTAVWPEQGLYVYVRQGRTSQSADPRAAEIYGMGLFVPVATDAFRSSPAGFLIPSNNQYTRETTDAPDGAPEDPFDWWLLTPIPPTQ